VKTVEHGIAFQGAGWRDISAMRNLYRAWNEGKDFSFCRIVFLVFLGRKTCLVAKRAGRLVGYDLFYVNKRDIYDNTVHEGFIALLEEELGHGLGTLLRTISGRHFYDCGVSGISSRIYKENGPSMTSAIKVGFKITETRIEPGSQKTQAYLVWDFNSPN
jgi:hypothetical protein